MLNKVVRNLREEDQRRDPTRDGHPRRDQARNVVAPRREDPIRRDQARRDPTRDGPTRRDQARNVVVPRNPAR